MLDTFGRPRRAGEAVFAHADRLRAHGFRDMDALHVAFAERQGARYFVTCDDGLLKKAELASLSVEVIDPVNLVEKLNI